MKTFRIIMAALFGISGFALLFDASSPLSERLGGFGISLVFAYFILPKFLRLMLLEKVGFDHSRLNHLNKINQEIENSTAEKKHIKNELQDLNKQKKKIVHEMDRVQRKSFEYELQQIDQLTQVEFGRYCEKLLEKIGYSDINNTVNSDNQGLDLLATMGTTSYGFQCRKHSSVLGNSVVQQALAGKTFYKLDKVSVISNNYFSASAKQLALEGNVELWDRDTLKEYLRDIYSAERNSKNEAENLESLSPSTGLETASSEPLPNAVENDESDWSDF